MKTLSKKTFRATFPLLAALISCGQAQPAEHMMTSQTNERTGEHTADGMTTDTATFGAGCFWCVEAVFTELNGVLKVTPGYAGGTTNDPDYKSVCSGTTGHAEVAQIIYDPSKVGFDELLEVFWQTHDPTTANRQGNDVGTQYRSVIFYHNDQQRERAEHFKAELDRSGAWSVPVITEIAPLKKFYAAEDYHNDYYAQNPDQGYCQYVIRPKLEKFRKAFADKLKP